MKAARKGTISAEIRAERTQRFIKILQEEARSMVAHAKEHGISSFKPNAAMMAKFSSRPECLRNFQARIECMASPEFGRMLDDHIYYEEIQFDACPNALQAALAIKGEILANNWQLACGTQHDFAVARALPVGIHLP